MDKKNFQKYNEIELKNQSQTSGPLCTVVGSRRLLLRNGLLPRRRLLFNDFRLLHHSQAAVVLCPLSTVVWLTCPSCWWPPTTALRTTIVSTSTAVSTITPIISTTISTVTTSTIAASNLL